MVYLYIVLMFLLSVLPFLTDIPFVFVPFRQRQEPLSDKPLLYFFRAIISYLLFAFLLYFSLNSTNLLFKVLCLFGLLVVLSTPYVMVARFVPRKPPFVRVAEVFAFYFISLSIGFYIERLWTNSALKDWRFYIVTLCVFLVFSSTGFIFKVLMIPKKEPNLKTRKKAL